MKKDPLGFVVTCSTPIARKPYKVKIYSLQRSPVDFKLVRFRLHKQLGEFAEHALASAAASEYAKLHDFPFVYAKALHNHRAPCIIYSWFFKEPPIKILESVFG